MQFSVVIPLFNKERHISRAIESVINQTFKDFELIVVDDGSTDKGADIVKSFPDIRISLIHQANAGVSSARNRGIEETKGDLIAFLDADDEWEHDFLLTIARLVKHYPNAGLYATDYLIRTSYDHYQYPKFYTVASQPWEGYVDSYFKAVALGDPLVCASAVCIPRSVFLDVGAFVVGKRMGEDIDMWGRVALKYPVALSRKRMAIYFQDATNRACSNFNNDDEHPFISTWDIYDRSMLNLTFLEDVNLYVRRLKLENARQHSLMGRYMRARELVTKDVIAFSPLRSVLWGTRLNVISTLAWRVKTYIKCLVC